MTIYAAGLRVGEAVSLRVDDIDSARMTIRVVQGKGRKDRYTILSPRLLENLRQYWKQYRPKEYLFEGMDPQHPIHESVPQKVYNRAKQQAGIRKGVGVHTLRHCFATHLLEAGVDLRTIQTLLGHNAISTTMLYLQVRQQHIAAHAGKFDLLTLLPSPPTSNRCTPRPNGLRQTADPDGKSPMCSTSTETTTATVILCLPLTVKSCMRLKCAGLKLWVVI